MATLKYRSRSLSARLLLRDSDQKTDFVWVINSNLVHRSECGVVTDTDSVIDAMGLPVWLSLFWMLLHFRSVAPWCSSFPSCFDCVSLCCCTRCSLHLLSFCGLAVGLSDWTFLRIRLRLENHLLFLFEDWLSFVDHVFYLELHVRLRINFVLVYVYLLCTVFRLDSGAFLQLLCDCL